MLFFTRGKFKCPTELSKTWDLENSNLEHPHVHFTTVTGPQTLFQFEDQALVLEKSFPPMPFSVFYGWATGLSFLANWGETQTLPQWKQKQLKDK